MKRYLLVLCCMGIVFGCLGQKQQLHFLAGGPSLVDPNLITRNFGLPAGPAASKLLSKLYFKAYSGFGFVSPGSFRIQSNSAIITYEPGGGRSITVVQTESKKGIGRGFKFGGGIGYALNDFLNAGIDVEFQKGQKITNDLSSYGGTYNYDTTSAAMHCNAVTITPHVLFKALAKPRFFIYNKLGVVFTLPFTLYTSGYGHYSDAQNWPPVPPDSVSSSHYTHNYKSVKTYKISLGVGFNVAFGINFRVNDRFRLFTEIFGSFSPLKPKSSVSNFVEENINLFYSAQYDYTVDPPLYLGYVLDQTVGINHITERFRYYKNGATTTETTIVETSPYPHSEYYITSNGTNDRFTVNLNAIGINCGVSIRF